MAVSILFGVLFKMASGLLEVVEGMFRADPESAEVSFTKNSLIHS